MHCIPINIRTHTHTHTHTQTHTRTHAHTHTHTPVMTVQTSFRNYPEMYTGKSHEVNVSKLDKLN